MKHKRQVLHFRPNELDILVSWQMDRRSILLNTQIRNKHRSDMQTPVINVMASTAPEILKWWRACQCTQDQDKTLLIEMLHNWKHFSQNFRLIKVINVFTPGWKMWYLRVLLQQSGYLWRLATLAICLLLLNLVDILGVWWGEAGVVIFGSLARVIFSRRLFWESQPGGQLKERRTGPAPHCCSTVFSSLIGRGSRRLDQWGCSILSGQVQVQPARLSAECNPSSLPLALLCTSSTCSLPRPRFQHCISNCICLYIWTCSC